MGPGGREGNPAGERGLAAVGARRPGWGRIPRCSSSPPTHEGASRQVRGYSGHNAPAPLR